MTTEIVNHLNQIMDIIREQQKTIRTMQNQIFNLEDRLQQWELGDVDISALYVLPKDSVNVPGKTKNEEVLCETV